MQDAASLAEYLRHEIRDERVLEAIAAVPRARFVPKAYRRHAYEDVALPIWCGQTISQPTVIARMLALLELSPSDRVLDVGTGSGYHAALLARLTAHVWTIERHEKLSARARAAAVELAIENVTFVVGDGAEGLAEEAPFDVINVAAAVGAAVPGPLLRQLGLSGRLVAPVGDTDQRLLRGRRTSLGIRGELLDPVRFVPLIRDRR
ncbi:MAG TPA: protein-L-isoaspartate(D-aspartate) O-methyltransferase [Solirubrobacteraceae bacterium]|jgi:protein-L-isoaspartate(D-aspartate) O-methyltransferase